MNTYKDEVEVSDIVSLFWERRRLIVFATVFGLLFGLTIALIKTPYYRAKTTLYPTETSKSSLIPPSLQNIAGNFGLSNFSEPEMIKLYPEIIRSERLLTKLMTKEYTDPATGHNDKLYTFLEYGSIENPKNMIDCVDKLKNMITAYGDSRTNLFTIEVYSDKPWLSAKIANDLVVLLDDYNRRVRVSKAKENRLFIERRKNLAKDSLDIAQNTLTKFQKRNADYSDSPELMARFQNYSSDLLARRQLYLAISQQYELAKVEEFKDIPVINVLDPARIPVLKAGPNKKIITIIGIVLGVGFGITLVVLKEIVIKFRNSIKLDSRNNEK